MARQFHCGVSRKITLQATCKLCNTHINIAHMGYSALKQHSEKKKHKGYLSILQKVKDKEKVEEADKPKCSVTRLFVKSSTSTSKATASSVETSDFAWDIGPSTSQTTVTEVVWTLPSVSCKGRDNRCFRVCFTKYTLQLCRCTPGVLQTTVSGLSNSKACFTWNQKRCHIWWHMA